MTMGIGTKAQRMTTGGSDDDYQDIGKVTEIGDISGSRDTQDVTAYDSTSGYREYDVGLKDGGEVTISVRYRPNADNAEGAQHAELMAAFDDGLKQNFRFIFPIEYDVEDGEQAIVKTWPSASFEAFITSFSMPVPLEEHISQSFTLKITGAISFGDYQEPDPA